MRDWPPVKAWTSIFPIKGRRHFVAINYGIEEGVRWVNLVCVVDGSLRFRVFFEDLNDSNSWLPGWQDIDNQNKIKEITCSKDKYSYDFENACLHPSDDSGLSLSSRSNDYRPWCIDEKD